MASKYVVVKEKYTAINTEDAIDEKTKEDRLSGLPSNLRLSSVDEYGFKRPANFDFLLFEKFISEYLSILTRRSRRWDSILNNKTSVGRSNKIKRFIRKGIPHSYREKVWLAVSGAEARKKAHPGHYCKLLKEPKNPELLETISLDLNRTYPDNINFKANSNKLNSLSNVLGAFGLHNPTIGYCQGLNYIAGLLLIVVDNEESVFWLLTVLVEEILPGYHTEDMTGTLTDLYVLGEIIRERKPLIWKHLEFNKIELSLVVTKWFICLFVEVLPIESVLRVWDCLFYEGNKILIRVSVALILSNEAEIFKSQDFSSLIECFKKMTKSEKVLYCHSFMEEVFKVTGPLPRDYIKKLREEGKQKVFSERKELEERKRNRRQPNK